jgi:uncharacterized protein
MITSAHPLYTKMRPWLFVASLAVNFGFLVGFSATVGHQAAHVPQASMQEMAKAMVPMLVNPAWIKSGTPTFMVAESANFVLPVGSINAGLWSCDGPTTFEWSYGHDESVHILEGEAHITYMGAEMTLTAGETAFFKAGTKATWTVPQRVYKSFVLHDPGKMAKLYRRLFSS